MDPRKTKMKKEAQKICLQIQFLLQKNSINFGVANANRKKKVRATLEGFGLYRAEQVVRKSIQTSGIVILHIIIKMFTSTEGKRKNPNEDQEFNPFEASKNSRGIKKQFDKWTNFQNRLYAEFISENLEAFMKPKKKLPINIFAKMSESIKIFKDNRQCRSHHQKMMIKYGTVENLVQQLIKVDTESCDSSKAQKDLSLEVETNRIEEKECDTEFKEEYEKLIQLSFVEYELSEWDFDIKRKSDFEF